MGDQVAIDEQVRELVAARREHLAQLVHHAVRQELEHLLDAELELVANGNGSPVRDAPPQVDSNGTASKVCTGPCGRDLPLSAFEARRSKCRECRRAEMRERKQRRAADGGRGRTSALPSGDAEEPPRGR